MTDKLQSLSTLKTCILYTSLITKNGMCIRFHETDVRVTGRVSMGVIGMRFEDGDEVIGMQMASQGDSLLVVSENGMGKRTVINEFSAQNRGGKGPCPFNHFI